MRAVKLSASIMCADLLNLGSDVATLEARGFDYLHFDMMDGHFVPEIGLGVFFLEQVARAGRLPIDVHLMVTDPERFVDPVIRAGASLVSIHSEATGSVTRILRRIRKAGRKAGLAVKRETPLSTLVRFVDDLDLVLLMAYAPGIRHQAVDPGFELRIRELSELLDARGRGEVDVAVDGGVSEAQVTPYREAGASFLILGSTGLFVAGTPLAEQADRIARIARS